MSNEKNNLQKKLLRKEFLTLRNNLSKDILKEKSLTILSKLYNLDEYKNSEIIFTYINANSELLTMPLIEKAWADKKVVAVPVMTEKAHEMVFIKINSFSELSLNKYSILEPPIEKENIIKSTSKTLIIVPGLVFTKTKQRLGYGGGYYDKFLTENKTLSNIALAMDFQFVPSIPIEPFDKTVDMIITETQIYK